MPVPTPEQIRLLGPAALPFERRGFDRDMQEGESVLFMDAIYNATNDGVPSNVVLASPAGIEKKPKAGRYLWVITEEAMHFVLENTPNPESERKIMCHTNITADGPALQGGELWFGTDGTVYINYRSGRYGAETDIQWHAVIKYFHFAGYKTVEVVD